jgi:ribonuclease BN (tRNA processing enzyme)
MTVADSAPVTVTVLGCGDAFGSGGRLHTSFFVRAPDTCFLIDCGASALAAMKRQGVHPNEVKAILITHLHGDHFGGIPFFLLDGQLVSKRTEPLVIAGPHGIEGRVREASEALFPGSSKIQPRFPVWYVELTPGRRNTLGAIQITSQEVVHPAGQASLGIRVECARKTISYSGDTEWTDTLIPLAQGADLFLCEAYTYEPRARNHLDYQTIVQRQGELGCRRIVLTHMSDDMLARTGESVFECAEEGMVLTV